MSKTDFPIRIAQIMGKMEKGGVEAVVMNYYRNIDRSKVQFDFIVDSDSKCPQEDEIVSLGGRVYRIPPYQDIKNNMKVIENIFRENCYSIVHAELTTMSIFSLKVAKKCGVPVRICHGHNTAGKGENKKNILKYALRPFSKIYATDYFACSKYAGEWLFGKRLVDNGSVKVFNNAIDIEKFQYNSEIRSKIRSELEIEDKFVIGHIGRFCFQKNHEFLIDVFNEVHKKEKNSVLLLIGEGELLPEIKEKVDRLNLSDDVIFLGVKENIYDYYQAMDIFVLPSRYEGLPVVGVEAQTSGLPCVFSDAMTEDVKQLDSTVFLNLSDSVVKWSDRIIAFKGYDRVDKSKKLKENGFDIRSESMKLQKFYLDKICK